MRATALFVLLLFVSRYQRAAVLHRRLDVNSMTSDAKACPDCETSMTVMATMPSLQRQGSWSFFLCPQCGKVERQWVERQSDVEDDGAEPGQLESEIK